MHKAAVVNARIERELKNKAEAILHKIGLTSAEAVRLFYKQICLNKGIPFSIKIPNAKTIKAMRDADAGKTYKAESVEALFKKLNS